MPSTASAASSHRSAQAIKRAAATTTAAERQPHLLKLLALLFWPGVKAFNLIVIGNVISIHRQVAGAAHQCPANGTTALNRAQRQLRYYAIPHCSGLHSSHQGSSGCAIIPSKQGKLRDALLFKQRYNVLGIAVVMRAQAAIGVLGDRPITGLLWFFPCRKSINTSLWVREKGTMRWQCHGPLLTVACGSDGQHANVISSATKVLDLRCKVCVAGPKHAWNTHDWVFIGEIAMWKA